MLAGAPAPAQEATQEGSSAPVEEIVVSGTRLATSDLFATSPITSVGQTEIQGLGTVNVESVLSSLPQVAPSDNGSNNDGQGVSTVNLRNLGTSRTLVLVNGRRYIYFNQNQVVDLNTIPTPLIESVDVVTGGRSAVYGSDAIAGVVNFRLKENFQGLEARGLFTQTRPYNDGQQGDVSITGGINTPDNRGNITGFVEYNKTLGIRSRARPFSSVPYDDSGEGSLIVGGSGAIPGGRLQGLTFPDGTTAPSRRFLPDGSLGSYSFDQNAYNYDADLYNQYPNERETAALFAHYDLTDSVRIYGESQFIRSTSNLGLPPTPSFGQPVTLQVNSPFLPAATQSYLQQFDPNNTGYVNAGLSDRFVDFGLRGNDFKRQAYRVLGGVKGQLPADWQYDGYVMFSETHTRQTQSGLLRTSALVDSVDTAFADPATLDSANPVLSPYPIAGLSNGGTLVCASAAARAKGCVPANVFGVGRISQAAVDYVGVNTYDTTSANTVVASLVFTNESLFNIPTGGPVGLVVGGEYRREAATYTPDPIEASFDITGGAAGLATHGGYNVKEFLTETNVPLLVDKPFAKHLELNAAARYSDYSIAQTGGVKSYSFGVSYAPVQDILLRGQYQRATRAANINELYGGRSQGAATVADPCNNLTPGSTLAQRCIAAGLNPALIGQNFDQTPEYFDVVGGNSGLRAETSDTWTGGIVLRPSVVPKLNLSVDYYHISIKDYIDEVGVGNILNLCYTQGLGSYCNLIERSGATGQLTAVNDLNLNAGSLTTSGVDFGVSYLFDMPGLLTPTSSLGVNLQATRLMDHTLVPVASIPALSNQCADKFGATCADPEPRWKGVATVTWTNGPLMVLGRWRYIGNSYDDGTLGYPLAVTELSPVNYFDLTGSYEVLKGISISAGVLNIANKQPRVLGDNDQADTANTWPAVYDVVGRRVFLGVNARF
jgi:outer membrane receptor protein involved in Fe transport